MTHNVLVYGTLRPGNTTPVTIPGQMFDLGAFPGIRLTPDGSFTCEVVEVDDDTLSRLDSYEGYSEECPDTSLYIRRRYTDVEAGIDAWIYEYNNETDRFPVVADGDWLHHTGKSSGGAAYFLRS